MRHSNSGRKLSRTPSHRKALLNNLAKALLIHGKIRTTEMKAKELRKIVESLITLAKRNDLHAKRQAYRDLNDHALVKRLFDDIGPLFANISGGYTRILKLAMPRKGDNAPMAIIELSNLPATENPVEATKAETSTKKQTKEAVDNNEENAVSKEMPKKAAKTSTAKATSKSTSTKKKASEDGEEKPKRTRKPKADAE